MPDGTMCAPDSCTERTLVIFNKNANTTDATRGSSLKIRVETRKQELELALAKLGPDDRARPDIELALNEVGELLTGNLDQIPHVVAAELNNWLEANKHVNEWHPKPKASIKH
jgi:hypothetical protein